MKELLERIDACLSRLNQVVDFSTIGYGSEQSLLTLRKLKQDLERAREIIMEWINEVQTQ
jgi:hypothetical protein